MHQGVKNIKEALMWVEPEEAGTTRANLGSIRMERSNMRWKTENRDQYRQFVRSRSPKPHGGAGENEPQAQYAQDEMGPEMLSNPNPDLDVVYTGDRAGGAGRALRPQELTG